MFRVGQDVEYFRDLPDTWLRRWKRFWHPEPGDDVTLGSIYTIENITPEGNLEFIGIRSPEDKYWAAGFAPECFRPVQKHQTDIGFAHEILRKVGRNATVKARA